MARGERRSAGGLGALVGLVVIVWLVVGVIAATQRHYFGGSNKPSCSKVSTTVISVIAGPLNYLGANPKIKCKAPQPSK